jgi:hypothetical protein
MYDKITVLIMENDANMFIKFSMIEIVIKIRVWLLHSRVSLLKNVICWKSAGY